MSFTEGFGNPYSGIGNNELNLLFEFLECRYLDETTDFGIGMN